MRTDGPRRYRSPDEDSARWDGFVPRDGDVVVSARSKHGTTWVQSVCLSLVHATADLPAPLPRLSPWLDWLVEPLDDVLARLDAQQHRRVVKTHTPLDGLPLHAQVAYVVAVRHPLDAAVSLWHQSANLRRDQRPQPPLPPLREWLAGWIEDDPDPREQLDSLPGVLHHLRDAWERRNEPNVVLLHYADLESDRDATMRRLAARLGTPVDDGAWPALVEAAGFPAMRLRADTLVPDPGGVLRERSAFFRRGRSGAAREVLGAGAMAAYARRVSALLPPDLRGYLHRP